jgi:hypothetical protein
MGLNLVSPSKKIVPEQVQPSPQNQAFTGKGHYLPDFCPVFLAIAVDRAVLAGGFRLQRAFAQPLNGISHKPSTCVAELDIFPEQVADCGCKTDYTPRILFIMPVSAVNLDEFSQDLEVFSLSAGKLLHEDILAKKRWTLYDKSQKSCFAAGSAALPLCRRCDRVKNYATFKTCNYTASRTPHIAPLA